MLNPGFGPVGLDLAQTYDAKTTDAICAQLAALREGLGRETGVMLDLNFSQKPEGLMRIASLAESFEVSVAPHNFYGHLATLMSAHFCAAIPNFRIMEFEGGDVPWNDDLVTHPPEVNDGELLVPTRPGWGCEVDEEAVRAHPPKQAR